MKFKLRVFLVSISLIFISSQAFAQELLRVGAGFAGTYPIFAAKLTDLINKNIDGYKAAAIKGNSNKALIEIDKGNMAYQISYTWTVKQTADGKSTIPVKAPSLCHIMTLYGSGFFAVSKKGGITNLSQLGSGKHRIWTGAKGGFFYNVLVPVLQAHGVDIEEIEKKGTILESFGYGDTVVAFQDRRLDATFFSGGVPYSLMLRIENKPGFHLINWNDDALKKLGELRPGIYPGLVPAGSYKGQDKDVKVPWYVNQLVTSTKRPDDLTYQVTKIMNEKAKEFHGLFPGSEEIGVNDPLSHNLIPVCPGSAKYYKEKGLM